MDRFLSTAKRSRMGLVAAIATAAAVVWAISATAGSSPDAPPAVVPVTRAAVAATVAADGDVQSPSQLSLGFQRGGRIVSVLVKEGDHVIRGALLARIEDDTERAQAAAAEANLDSARERLRQVQTGLTPTELAEHARLADQSRVAVRNAQRDLANARNIARNNVGGLRRAVERARVSGEEADLRTSELRVSQEQAEVNLLRRRFDDIRSRLESDRHEVDDARDRLRDAENASDQTAINNARYRIDVLESRIAAAESDQARADADLTTAVATLRGYVQEVDRNRVALREARRRLGDASDTLGNGMASAKQQVDSARNSLAASEAQLRVTTAHNRVGEQVRAADVAGGFAAVAQATSSLADARKALADTELRAPTAGVVGHVEAKVGQVAPSLPFASLAGSAGAGQATTGPSPSPAGPGSAAASSSGAQPGPGLITLAQTSGLQVKADFNEHDVAQMHTGDPATVVVDALPDRRLDAHVAEIDPIERVVSNVVTYQVTMVLDEAPSQLKPGMTATANVTIARVDNALTVPRTAVRSPEGASPTVTVVRPDGRREPRMVITGLQSPSRVQILGGIGLGERVVRTIAPPPDLSG